MVQRIEMRQCPYCPSCITMRCTLRDFEQHKAECARRFMQGSGRHFTPPYMRFDERHDLISSPPALSIPASVRFICRCSSMRPEECTCVRSAGIEEEFNRRLESDGRGRPLTPASRAIRF
jgi:hypothetical protein